MANHIHTIVITNKWRNGRLELGVKTKTSDGKPGSQLEALHILAQAQLLILEAEPIKNEPEQG